MSSDSRLSMPRPDVHRVPQSSDVFGIVEKPLGTLEVIYAQAWVRKLVLLIVLICIWEAYARYIDNELIFPAFTSALSALYDRLFHGELSLRILTSLKILVQGYSLGVAIAAVFTALAIRTRIGNDFLELMTAMFNPLPAIALLPLAMLWFGLGSGSVIFVLVHSVLWAVALNTHSGFRAVSATLRMVGQNYGLGGLRFITSILIPAAFPSILTGLKIGWAFAWRTLIAAELVFGVTSGSGGLGWFIFESKNQLQTDVVFAGMLTIIIIGLAVENVIFRVIELRTVRRWGMQS